MVIVKQFLQYGANLRKIRMLLNWMENKYDPNIVSDNKGIGGADGKLYDNIWHGLQKKPRAFNFFVEKGSTVLGEPKKTMKENPWFFTDSADLFCYSCFEVGT